MRTEKSNIDSRFHVGEYVKVIGEGEKITIGKIVEVWQNKREGNRIFYRLENEDRWFIEEKVTDLFNH